MKTTIQPVEVNEVIFNVEYGYTEYRAATYYDPPEFPEVDIISICLEGCDVTELLSEWTINQILERIEAPTRQDELEAVAEMRFEEMREQSLFKD